MYEGMKPEKRHMMTELIIRREWEMFKKVASMDGPVECQEDWPTFHIMRYSYYCPWTDKMIRSYAQDLTEAMDAGRNLVMEKYAYMMAFTEPEYYAKNLAPYLPSINGETGQMINEIADFLVADELAFSQKHPKLSAKGRPVRGSGERGVDTSIEVYTKGELKTYSKYTLECFLDFVRACKAENTSFAFLVKDQMVKLYGYTSIEEAERKM